MSTSTITSTFTDTSTSTDTNALWFSPLDKSSCQVDVLNNCARHLLDTIKSQPGISIPDLKRKYENVLEGFEVDCLVKLLMKSGSIEMISERFLQ